MKKVVHRLANGNGSQILHQDERKKRAQRDSAIYTVISIDDNSYSF